MSISQWELIQPFPKKLLKTLPKAGGLEYVPVEHYVQRLLAEHGPYDWKIQNVYDLGTQVSVVGWLTLTVDGRESTYSGTGSSKDLDRDNAVETAEAQSFKRACAKAGLGLHLYGGYWLPYAESFQDVRPEGYTLGKDEDAA